jgi:hypothetical protein
MAQVILSTIGTALAGPIGGIIGAGLGRAIDQTALNALSPARQIGSRLEGIRLSQSAQGAPIKQVFGKGRVATTVIWAARLKENRSSRRASKTGPKTERFSYSLSFAIGLCEGPIDGIGRIWADGQIMDQSRLSFRLYKGHTDQMPDTLIEAIEGESPAYRGLAYMVFEDLDLSAFGNRLPNLSVEVFRRPKGLDDDLETEIEGVCLIPGAGEFVYATEHNQVHLGFTRARTETQNTQDGRPDFIVALDQLDAHLPKVKRVNLVISWFGDDLRVGACQIRPGVEDKTRRTRPISWQVAGINRLDAYLISRQDNRPVYGGTPSDYTVISAIKHLKSRGFEVTLIPFILMDIAPGNVKPDPYGATSQSAFPWRGRITCNPAPGRAGSPDQTGVIATEVKAFFGNALSSHFSVTGETISYSGPNEWGLRRFVLHLAALSKAAGGVACLLLGSELRGVTTLRSGVNTYPAVTELRALASEVKAMLGSGTSLSYAADWSEYYGHHTTTHLSFHLDPLWADTHIDFVGIDWYPPLSDWRDQSHLDQAQASSIYDLTYLKSRVQGGEGYDWYYASEPHRQAQIRTPITDGAYNEPWVFRPKDIVNWWSRAHFNRVGSVRSTTATAWVPRSKPIRFIEYGCGAVDKGSNAPNLFIDPKSSENALPPFSTGARDDLIQRQYLRAVQGYFKANNPQSPLYNGPMISSLEVWAWDARPYPYFPQNSQVWGDGGNWQKGHWLNGRMSSGGAANILREITSQVGLRLDTSEATGVIDGYVIEAPQSAAFALEPVLTYLGLNIAERGTGLKVLGLGALDQGVDLKPEDLAYYARNPILGRRDLINVASSLTLRCYNPNNDYQIEAICVRNDEITGADPLSLDLSLSLSPTQAREFATYSLRQVQTVRYSLQLDVGPRELLRFETGDRISFLTKAYVISTIDKAERPSITLVPLSEPRHPALAAPEGGGLRDANIMTPVVTFFQVLDVPPFGTQEDIRPLIAAVSDPFQTLDVYAGAELSNLRQRGVVTQTSTVGEVLKVIPPSQGDVILRRASIEVRLEGQAPQSRLEADILSGENIIYILNTDSEWERLQFLTVTPLGFETYRLSGLVRGQGGTASHAPIPMGAMAIIVPEIPERADISLSELRLKRIWRAGLAGFSGMAESMIEQDLSWQGVALRPRAPVHGRLKGRFGKPMRIDWIRCARIGGDSFELEPPFEDGGEAYRLRVYDGQSVKAEFEVTEPRFIYSIAQQRIDFPSGFTNQSRLEITQKSTTYGYGQALVIKLL